MYLDITNCSRNQFVGVQVIRSVNVRDVEDTNQVATCEI